jgi:hypothetical protein
MRISTYWVTRAGASTGEPGCSAYIYKRFSGVVLQALRPVGSEKKNLFLKPLNIASTECYAD